MLVAVDGELKDPIPVSRPFFFGREMAYVEEALRTTRISGSGPHVERMESLVAEAVGVRYAVATSSGTAALDLALEVLGVHADDEVIVPDFTMFAPIAALMRRGVTLVPVDVDDSWNLDPEAVARAVTERTKGIVVVHTYGHPARVDRIVSLARERGLWVIEDTAEALGATLHGQAAGSFGDLATFSFYANKVVTSGEGGAVVTNDPELAARARDLRSLCFGDTWASRFVHSRVGFNFRLSNVLAALACAQLEHLDEALAVKRAIAAHYSERLADLPDLELPPDCSEVEHSYWVFGVLLPPSCDRTAIAERLLGEGIETRPFFHPVHDQPCVTGVRGSFPGADRLARRGIYLPSFVGMSDGQIDRVVGALRRALAT